MRARDYRKAYAVLSPAVQREVPYWEFAGRSEDIRDFRVLALSPTERHETLARYYVKGRIKLRHDGQMFAALYAGRVVMTRIKGAWRVEEVELKPLSQKRIAPDYRI